MASGERAMRKLIPATICALMAAFVAAEEIPFLGIWTNAVSHTRITVNVAHDFQTNGVVIVGMMGNASNNLSNLPYTVIGTDSYLITNNTIILYGQSGRFPSPLHEINHAQTTNYFRYDSNNDVLVSLDKDGKAMNVIHRLKKP
jgi:hypothetical protein